MIPPLKPQKGEAIHPWARRAWEWMRGIRPVAGPGIVLRSGPSGTVISLADAAGRTDPPPFWPRRIRRAAEDSYDVTVHPGWLIERVTQGGSPAPDGVVFHEPLIDPGVGDLSLHAVPRPTLLMALGDSAWLHYETLTTGDVDVAEPIELLVAADNTTVHYQPENPDEAGTRGDYYVRLFKLVADTDGAVGARVYQQSDVEHYHDLWTGENVGYGSRVFQQHDPVLDRYLFRGLVGGYGLTAAEDGDDIDLDFDAATLGTGEPIYLPAGHADKTAAGVAEYRSLEGGESGRDEIEVYRKSAGVTGVRGNGFDAVATAPVTAMTVVDGLVTALATTPGANLNLRTTQKYYRLESVDGESNVMVDQLEPDGAVTHYWRKGIYIGTVDPVDGLGVTVDVDAWAVFS